MRSGQQNRRMRGRGNTNNNRKGPNPLSRNYESNGPDVKIRGNAQHIAEKYMTLARDAQASGDRVIAENYLQHAEHYNRIILAAQAQNPVPVQREESFNDDFDDDETAEQGNIGVVEHSVYDGSGPQPVIEGTPAEVMYGEENSRSANRGPRQQNQRSDRQQGERQNNDRNPNERQGRMQRPRRQPRPEYNAEQAQDVTTEAPAEREAFVQQADEQPFMAAETPAVVETETVVENVKAPVRRRPRVSAPVAETEAAEVAPETSAETEEAPLRRPRRVLRPRRTTREASATENEAQVQDNALADGE